MYLRIRDNVSVEYECTDGIFTRHGTFVKQDEDSIMIRGTVGDGIGKPIIIPKSRIVSVTVNAPGEQDAT